MTHITCNTCGKAVSPTPYGVSPDGWLSVSLRGTPYVPPADYCSVACAMKGLEDHEASERALAGQALLQDALTSVPEDDVA